ncbi:MAG: VWA domain-containing protein [Verrucomicrobia bacterium]|nr:VWA domain-containing protein [Verrucomicrobiota bacterium]
MISILSEWIEGAFGNPRMLWLLLAAVPLLSAFLWWAWRKRQALIAQFVQSRLLAHLTVGLSKTIQKTRLFLLVAAVGLLILTLARPRWGFAWEEAKQQGLDIVVAIDTSRSMLAEDISPSRLARAKLAALDLLRLAKYDRLGLIAFAGTAFLQCPLTLDEEAFRQSVEALQVGIIPQGGTALTEAIETAVKAFTAEGDNHKALILLTDGEDHEAGAMEATQKAVEQGLRIFTVGVGTPNGELLRSRDETGALAYIKDDQGNVVKSRLNEPLLTQIATAANGFYLPMSGANTMQVLYDKGLAPLPKSDLTSKLVKRYHERYQWFLGLAIALLLLEMFLPERKRVSRSELALSPATENERRNAAPPLPAGEGRGEGERRNLHPGVAWAGRLTALLLLLLCPALEAASPAKALRKYEARQYKEAEQEYQKLLDRNPEDTRLHYNAGAAAYQAAEYEEATKHFSASLASPDLKVQERAYYNLGNAFYRLGESQPDPTKKQQAWELSTKQYEGAIKLDPNDLDAKYNLEFVKKKLEELKQQQNQSDQKNQQGDDKNDKNEKNDSQSAPQDQPSKESQPKSDSNKSENNPSEQNQPKPQPEEQKEQGQSPDKQDKERKQPSKPENKAVGQNQEKSGEQTGDAALSEVPEGQMTPEQAKRLLDAQKNAEKAMIFIPREKLLRKDRIFKDW